MHARDLVSGANGLNQLHIERGSLSGNHEEIRSFHQGGLQRSTITEGDAHRGRSRGSPTVHEVEPASPNLNSTDPPHEWALGFPAASRLGRVSACERFSVHVHTWALRATVRHDRPANLSLRLLELANDSDA